jgi:spore germination cell wall hydrolase CwlJ-like protein
MIRILFKKYTSFILFGLVAGAILKGSMQQNPSDTKTSKFVSTVSVEKLQDVSIDKLEKEIADLSEKQRKELDIMARTIYGEARGEKSDNALKAIAHVILNRTTDKEKKWDSCPIKVSQQKYQFSCWNRNDPNYKLITKVTLKNKNFRRAYMAALQAIKTKDITNGANHYHSVFMKRKPRWAKSKKMIALARIGNHKFYRA